jgi:hypothetical protein
LTTRQRARLPVGIAGGQQRFIVVQAPGGGADHDDVPERRPVTNLLVQRQERLVDNQNVITGMLGDEGEVVGVQPRVEWVGN